MGTDAQKWAAAFARMHDGDYELMIGWFANAIMAGWDEGRRRLRAEAVAGSATPTDKEDSE
jgi:hypothetical protein